MRIPQQPCRAIALCAAALLPGCVQPAARELTPAVVSSARCAADVLQQQGFVLEGAGPSVPSSATLTEGDLRRPDGTYGFSAERSGDQTERDRVTFTVVAAPDSGAAPLRVQTLTLRRRGDGSWGDAPAASIAAQRAERDVRARCGSESREAGAR